MEGEYSIKEIFPYLESNKRAGSRWLHITGKSSIGKTYIFEVLKRKYPGLLIIEVYNAKSQWHNGDISLLSFLLDNLAKGFYGILLFDECKEMFSINSNLEIFKQKLQNTNFEGGVEYQCYYVVTLANAPLYMTSYYKKLLDKGDVIESNPLVSSPIDDALKNRCIQVVATLKPEDIKKLLIKKFNDFIINSENKEQIIQEIINKIVSIGEHTDLNFRNIADIFNNAITNRNNSFDNKSLGIKGNKFGLPDLIKSFKNMGYYKYFFDIFNQMEQIMQINNIVSIFQNNKLDF